MDEKERKAFEGDAQAQCDMGDDYFFEAFDADIEDKDVLYRKAIYWYHRAAQKGHAASQYNLAYQYEHGLGIEIDLEQAVYWYRRAANQGYGAAENNLGHLYETGCGLPQGLCPGPALVRPGGAARRCRRPVQYGHHVPVRLCRQAGLRQGRLLVRPGRREGPDHCPEQPGIPL